MEEFQLANPASLGSLASKNTMEGVGGNTRVADNTMASSGVYANVRGIR